MNHITVQQLIEESHDTARLKGWWDEEDGQPWAIPLKLSLIGTEVTEAIQADRAYEGDTRILEEIADIFIRAGDLAYYISRDAAVFEQILNDKLETNKGRPYRHNRKY